MGRPPVINREQIIRTARDVFTLKGFDSATLAEIAGKLHVTPAAVLRHFESKQALFRAAMAPEVELPQCILDLARIDAASDPRIVLRRLAEEWVPFARATIGQTLVVSMHERRRPAIVMPFDPTHEESPPRKGLRLVTNYFRRAKKAGVVAVEDPRAAALLFMGTLVSYVFIHHILNVEPRPYPLPGYIDALIDLWTDGAIVQKKPGGSRVTSKIRPPEKNHSDRRAGSRRGRGSDLPAPDAKAEAARPLRNARGADRQRGVARRRPRNPRSDR